MSSSLPQLDAIILGGGIAGLWTLRRLLAAGRSAVLLTTTPLGSGQSIASQGIIHGGIKYALGGAATSAAAAIAAMPSLWHACLAAHPPHGHPDLSAARILSDSQHLWTTPGFISKLAAVAASKAIRTPVEKIPRERWPQSFNGAPGSISVYEVAEPVLDAASVIAALAEPVQPHIAIIDRVASINPAEDAVTIVVAAGHGPHESSGAGQSQLRTLTAQRLILCAGAGNADLVALSGQTSARIMQRRPLHMVMVRSASPLPRLFGHCLGASTTPRITITTGVDAASAPVWYIGGKIAEDGVPRTVAAQRAAARDELRACVPWADLSRMQFATFHIDRAEGLSADGSRPDEPVIQPIASGRILAAWPTKLAFALLTADRLLAMLPPSAAIPQEAPPTARWPRPAIAQLPWNVPEAEWSE